MPNFLEFIKARERSAPLEIGTSQKSTIAKISSELNGLSISSSKVTSFANRVTAVAHSSDFLAPVSDAIGTPKPGESEDEFVARGKAVIVDQLRKTLKLK